MTRPVGALERSLAALTIGVAQGEKQRIRALADTITGEYEQQVHVPISGQATSAWTFSDTSVQWELPFLYAPLQRRVPFATPHFTYGIEQTAGQGTLVLINAQVIGWTVTDAQWYVGATVRFASFAPGAATPVAYSAIAHLSFEGYATMAESNEFAQ